VEITLGLGTGIPEWPPPPPFEQAAASEISRRAVPDPNKLDVFMSVLECVAVRENFDDDKSRVDARASTDLLSVGTRGR
jgi:hypothetical protein